MKNKVVFGLASFLIIITLFFSYRYFSKNLAISYYDEEEWVGGSYFFQFYINGNFDKNIWDTVSSKDQPMLTKFLFGAWLYPKYLNAKRNDNNLDYSKFLISRGFNFVDGLRSYAFYVKSLGNEFVTLQTGDAGFSNDLIRKYGNGIQKNIDLILYVRILNTMLLTAAVVVLTFFLKRQRGAVFALGFLFLYGFNTLIVDSGLRAHSEALFLLFFNSSMISMFIYFLTGEKLRYLIIFSILLGLCFSTKLNGILLYFVYLTLFIPNLISNHLKSGFLAWMAKIVMPFFIAVTIFIVLNPYVFSDPLNKIRDMFKHRQNVVTSQMSLFPDDALLNIKDRFLQIPRVFYSNESILRYNNVKFDIGQKRFGLVLFTLFAIGIYSEARKAKRGNKFSFMVLVTFFLVFLITGSYLQLTWERYLVHLVFFFIYYQLSGFIFCLEKVKKDYS